MPAPTNGLQVFYNLEDKTLGSYIDLSPNANHGVPRNSPSVTTGTVGNSIHITGTGADATATSVSLSTFTNADISGPNTIAAWLRADSVGAGRIAWAFRNNSTTNYRIFGFLLRGATTVWLASGGPDATGASSVRSALSNPDIVASKWYHLVVTFNTSKASAIYLGGTFASAPAQDFFADPGRVRRIGNNAAGTGWAGDVDEFRFYNRILTSTEINNIFTDATDYPLPKKRRGEYLPATYPGAHIGPRRR